MPRTLPNYRSPGIRNADMAIFKNIALTEMRYFQLRLEAYNVTNSLRPGNPAVNLNSNTFGQITTASDPRLLQFALQRQRRDDGWLHPPWNVHKSRPSVLDVERLLWQHRAGIQQCLAGGLDSEGNIGE